MNCSLPLRAILAVGALAVGAADLAPGSLVAPELDSFLLPTEPANRIFRPAPASAAPPIRRFESVSELHADYSRDFASRPGFGVSRLQFLPPEDFLTLENERYRVRTPDLLGLEGLPTAYVSGHGAVTVSDLSRKEGRSLLRKRELDDFELQAVPKLRAGKDLVLAMEELLVSSGTTTNRVPGIRVVGALRATTQCVACHQVPEGSLLGALSFTLVPAETQEPKLVSHVSVRP